MLAENPRTFREIVWELVREIPRGRVMTYGQVASAVGAPRGARAVGYMLYFTPEEARVPCQRVVNRYGGLAAAYGWGGYARHRADLLADGVEVRDDYTVDLGKYGWTPNAELVERLVMENVLRRQADGKEWRMSTELIYQTDSYAREFNATVLRVEGSEVLLDRTAFYPGG